MTAKELIIDRRSVPGKSLKSTSQRISDQLNDSGVDSGTIGSERVGVKRGGFIDLRKTDEGDLVVRLNDVSSKVEDIFRHVYAASEIEEGKGIEERFKEVEDDWPGEEVAAAILDRDDSVVLDVKGGVRSAGSVAVLGTVPNGSVEMIITSNELDVWEERDVDNFVEEVRESLLEEI